MSLRVKLKDIRVSWVRGRLHRNGVVKTEEQVIFSLQAKHKQQGNEIPLTRKELQDIIYKDSSRFSQKIPPDDEFRLKMKQLEITEKSLEIQRLNREYRIEDLEQKKRILELLNNLMDKSAPSDYNVEMYQRMNPHYVVLAIQGMHTELSVAQCRLIIGAWVRRNL